eukprot:gene16357-19460_t
MRKGDLVFAEQSFASIPVPRNIVEASHCMLCCTKILTPETRVKCTYGCSFSFCSDACANDLVHQLECSFVTKVTEACIEAECDFSLALLVVRVQLKKNIDESAYLQSVGSLTNQRDAFSRQQRDFIAKYTVFANKFLQLLEADGVNPGLIAMFPREDIIDTVCAIVVNAFSATEYSQRLSTGFFYQAALLNHSCEPNAFYSIDKNNLEMRLLADVEKDANIFDSYVDLLQPTYERQVSLMQTKLFFCKCARCSDPTEGGRHMASINCVACSNGLVSPIVLYNETDNAIVRNYQCTSCQKASTEDIKAKVESISKLMAFLSKSGWKTDAKAYLETAKKMGDALLSHLHANHVVRLQYHVGMSNCFAHMEDYEASIDHSKSVRRIVKAVLRGNSSEMVECYEQLADLHEKQFLYLAACHHESQTKGLNSVVSPHVLKGHLKQSNRYNQKAHDMSVICFGPSGSKTVHLLAQVKRSSETYQN